MATTYKQIMEEARRLVPEVSVQDVRGRIDKFSLDALMNIAAKAGLSVRIKVARSAA